MAKHEIADLVYYDGCLGLVKQIIDYGDGVIWYGVEWSDGTEYALAEITISRMKEELERQHG